MNDMDRKRQKAMNAYLGKFKEREMDDLERLAREFHNAPKYMDRGMVQDNICYWVAKSVELNGDACQVFNFDQIKAKRNELSGKPKEWVNDWARYRMQLHPGTWIELSDHPDKDVERKVEIIGYGEALDGREGFRRGLEKRVVEETLDIPTDLVNEACDAVLFGEDKSVQDHELDGSEAVEWADRFPVRTVCEYENYTMGEWRKGEVIAHYKNVIVIADCDSGFEGVYKHQVRPFKSDEEKAIEEIQSYLENRDDGDSIAVAMYKAIYEKK